MIGLDRRGALELDIDPRLRDVWDVIGEVDWTLDVAANAIRAAYQRGYEDSILEARARVPGKLYRDNGFRLP